MPPKALTATEWLDEIREGLRFRRLFGLEDSWPTLEALFYNVHDSNAHEGPNVVFSTGDALLSTLTVPNPYLMVKARRPDHVEGARVVESVNNLLVEEMKLKQEAEDAVLGAYLYGVGFWKIGFDSEWGFDPQFDVGGSSMPTGMTPTQFDRQGRRIEYDSTIHPGMPWVKYVSAHDIVVPWGTKRLEEARWVAHRVVRHIDDLKADPKYTNRRELRPVMSMEDFVRSYQRPRDGHRLWEIGPSTGTQEYVELWEIHDTKTGKILVVATGHTKFFRNEESQLNFNGPPFVSLRFVNSTRALWTTPDAFYLQQAQAELADISLQSAKQRRLSALKFIADEDAFDNDELEKATSSQVGAVIKKKAGIAMNEALLTLQPGTNQMLWQEGEITRRNARELVGFSRNQMGEFEQTGRRTASEAMIVNQSSELRMTRRQDKMRTLYGEAFGKINAILFHHWNTPRLTEVLDETGQAQWVRFNGPGLKGEYRYEVAMVPAQEETLQTRRMMALQTYMMMSQDPTVDQVELRRFLVRAFNDPEFSAIFSPQVLGGQQDAALSLQMQTMQQGGRGLTGGGGSQQGGQMPQLPGPSG